MRIPFIDTVNKNSELKNVSALLDTLPQHQLSHQPWLEFKGDCHTSFVITHSKDAIFLKFYVQENTIKVDTYQINGKVHKDNCVEFFVSFGAQKEYYNIELNCVGVCLIAYGKQRLDRVFLKENLISKIKTHINIQTAPRNSTNKFKWELTAIIPIEVFEHSNLNNFSKLQGFGNFFKCGDNLPKKHFYAWSNIESLKPNFHLPEFFGALEFD